MLSGLQDLFPKAFSYAATGNPGLLAMLTLIVIAAFLGAVATATKDWFKTLVQKYLVAAFVFGVAPLAAYSNGYIRSLGVLLAFAALTGLLAWRSRWIRSRTWLPAMLALIPFALVANWEQRYLERLRVTGEPPTVAVLMFESRSITPTDAEVRAWRIFRAELTRALKPIGRVRVQPLQISGENWDQIALDNALEQLKARDVYPDVMIVSQIKLDPGRTTVWQQVHEVVGDTTKLIYSTPTEAADPSQYLQLAQRQTLMMLPYLSGDVLLTQQELERACAAVLEEHVRSLVPGTPRHAQLEPMVGTCPGISKLADILKNGLLPASAGPAVDAAREANVNTAVAAVSTVFGGSE
jgi:hypothetical protein